MDYDVDDSTVDDYDCDPTETRSTANVDDDDGDEEQLYPTRPPPRQSYFETVLASHWQ
jgi:hypothetical protein